MSVIHLVERSDKVRKTDRSKNEWETGHWVVTEENAQKLIGSTLYLHRAKLQASHFGGTILGFRVEDTGPDAGRIVFKLRADADCKGVKTDGKGWVKDAKIFWDAPVAATSDAA